MTAELFIGRQIIEHYIDKQGKFGFFTVFFINFGGNALHCQRKALQVHSTVLSPLPFGTVREYSIYITSRETDLGPFEQHLEVIGNYHGLSLIII